MQNFNMVPTKNKKEDIDTSYDKCQWECETTTASCQREHQKNMDHEIVSTELDALQFYQMDLFEKIGGNQKIAQSLHTKVIGANGAGDVLFVSRQKEKDYERKFEEEEQTKELFGDIDL